MLRKPRVSRKIAGRNMTRSDLRKMLQNIRAKRLKELPDVSPDQGRAVETSGNQEQLKSNSETGINVRIFPCNNAAEHVVSECVMSARHSGKAEVNNAQSSTTSTNVALCENLLTQVTQKIEALQNEMKLYESQNSHLKVLQQEYRQMLNKLQSEREEFEAYKQEEKKKLEAEIEEGRRKIRLQKKIRERHPLPAVAGKQAQKASEKHADVETIAKLQKKLRLSNNENDRLKKKLELAEKEKDLLKAMVKQLEEQRLNLLEKIERKTSDTKEVLNMDRLLAAYKGDCATTVERLSTFSSAKFQFTNSELQSNKRLSHNNIASTESEHTLPDSKLRKEVMTLNVQSMESHVCDSREHSRFDPLLDASTQYSRGTSQSSMLISTTLVARFNYDESVAQTSPLKCSSSPLLQAKGSHCLPMLHDGSNNDAFSNHMEPDKTRQNAILPCLKGLVHTLPPDSTASFRSPGVSGIVETANNKEESACEKKLPNSHSSKSAINSKEEVRKESKQRAVQDSFDMLKTACWKTSSSNLGIVRKESVPFTNLHSQRNPRNLPEVLKVSSAAANMGLGALSEKAPEDFAEEISKETSDVKVDTCMVGPPPTEELIRKIKSECGILDVPASSEAKVTNNIISLEKVNTSSSSHSSESPECLKDLLKRFEASVSRHIPPTCSGMTQNSSLVKKYSHIGTAATVQEKTEARKSRSMQLHSTATLTEQDQSPVRSTSRTWALDSGGQKMFLTIVSKEIDPFTQVIVYKFQNGDQKELHPDGKVVYKYGKSGTAHTISPCGNKEIKFANGQVEMHHRNGDIEVTYPDGTVRNIYASGEEVRKMPDGAVAKKMADGTETVEYPNGQREVRTEFYRSRYYPNGTVKTVYADGKQVTRYSNGRVRVKDKDGMILVNNASSALP